LALQKNAGKPSLKNANTIPNYMRLLGATVYFVDL